MTAINTKNNIWIEGFSSILGEYNEKLGQYSYYDKDKIVMYYGKTSEISEEIAKECVKQYTIDGHEEEFIGYDDYLVSYNYFRTAKESIQSACSFEYCIIYRIK